MVCWLFYLLHLFLLNFHLLNRSDVIEALELLRNALTVCSGMSSHRCDEDMLISISKSTLTALYTVQQVCDMRYIYQNKLVEKDAPKMVLTLLMIFSEPLLWVKEFYSMTRKLNFYWRLMNFIWFLGSRRGLLRLPMSLKMILNSLLPLKMIKML